MEGNADREGISRVINGMESIWSLGWKEKHTEGEGYRRKRIGMLINAARCSMRILMLWKESNMRVQRWVDKVLGVKRIRISVEIFFFYQFRGSPPTFVKSLGWQVEPL
jgi:hypothetical protein